MSGAACVEVPPSGPASSGPVLAARLREAAALVARHRAAIDRLNVFPVPDGDTGTNLTTTLAAVAAAVPAAGTLAEVAAAVRRSTVRAAQGNSGIIASQWLSGLCRALSDGLDGCSARQAAADAARGAVGSPVEGTMVTVAEAAAVPGGWDVAAEAAWAAVERTPHQLAVLARARVVDAGGVGLAMVLDALAGVSSRLVLLAANSAGDVPAPPPTAAAEPAAGTFEVIVHLAVADVTQLRAAWAAVGESIAVTGQSGEWTCHVHTADAGAAIEAVLDLGRPSNIRVTAL